MLCHGKPGHDAPSHRNRSFADHLQFAFDSRYRLWIFPECIEVHVLCELIDGGTSVALLVVPEPNALSMLAGSLGLALGLQRFRRRRA